ncbi:MAG: ATP-binding protein [Clostridiales bacterium]|nr:ATP-binding protein [Clostridiales bacterium]
MTDNELLITIQELLQRKVEGGYWDFKSQYPEIAEDKLHDIICMANNLEDRDAYLIYGANDDGSICGIESSEIRLHTADFIKFLRSKPFAGGYIPDVELRPLSIEGHEIDVLIVYNSHHTPYYLQTDFCNRKDKRIRAGAIYTRTADINTPKECTASVEHTEYLWRKRYGYDIRPSERFALLLDDYENWSETNWDNDLKSYHKDFPEYQIIAGEHSDGYENIRYFYDDEKMLYSEVNLNYLSTALYSTEFWYMDMGRCIVPKLKPYNLDYKGFYFYINRILMKENYSICSHMGSFIATIVLGKICQFSYLLMMRRGNPLTSII